MDRAHARQFRRTGEALSATICSVEDVRELHRALSTWDRWGDRDQLGTLHWITPGKRIAAARGVRSGRCVSCSRALPTEPAADNEHPVAHQMTGTAADGWGGDAFRVAAHGYAVSHIDALCHIFLEGRLYNAWTSRRWRRRAARRRAGSSSW